MTFIVIKISLVLLISVELFLNLHFFWLWDIDLLWRMGKLKVTKNTVETAHGYTD